MKCIICGRRAVVCIRQGRADGAFCYDHVLLSELNKRGVIMETIYRNKEPFAGILPTCCGKRMLRRYETTKFIEIWCESCGDIVLIRRLDNKIVMRTDS